MRFVELCQTNPIVNEWAQRHRRTAAHLGSYPAERVVHSVLTKSKSKRAQTAGELHRAKVYQQRRNARKKRRRMIQVAGVAATFTAFLAALYKFAPEQYAKLKNFFEEAIRSIQAFIQNYMPNYFYKPETTEFNDQNIFQQSIPIERVGQSQFEKDVSNAKVNVQNYFDKPKTFEQDFPTIGPLATSIAGMMVSAFRQIKNMLQNIYEWIRLKTDETINFFAGLSETVSSAWQWFCEKIAWFFSSKLTSLAERFNTTVAGLPSRESLYEYFTSFYNNSATAERVEPVNAAAQPVEVITENAAERAANNPNVTSSSFNRTLHQAYLDEHLPNMKGYNKAFVDVLQKFADGKIADGKVNVSDFANSLAAQAKHGSQSLT